MKKARVPELQRVDDVRRHQFLDRGGRGACDGQHPQGEADVGVSESTAWPGPSIAEPRERMGRPVAGIAPFAVLCTQQSGLMTQELHHVQRISRLVPGLLRALGN
jgi:hypothetical protein